MTVEPREVTEGDLLFTPSPERVAASRLARFLADAGAATGRRFDGYDEAWRWSVEAPGEFWSFLARWAEVPFRRQAAEPLAAPVRADGRPSAEHARFFAGAELNYVDLVRRHDPALTALVALDESGHRAEYSYGELLELAGRARRGLQELGVSVGDRVAAVLPNGVAAVATFLATASLGAIWSSCAPEFGAASMADRFRQISPAVLVAVSSYRYGGREFDLTDRIAELAAGLDGTAVTTFEALIGGGPAESVEPVAVDFSHPLWILYSSGTTGLPKAIVHGHGGIVLEHLKALSLHLDLGVGDRFFWFSTTGWMMWNFLVGGLLVGATIVCYDGSPVHPGPFALFDLAAAERVTYFGTSAPFLEACRRTGERPRDGRDLSFVRAVGSTGAPLSPEGFAWATEAIGDDVAVGSISGGTDVCTAFLAGCPLAEVRAGELQCAALGADVEAFGADGEPVVGEVGELVVTTPLPSMPVALWGDSDGHLLHEAYFDLFPGVWRHGDWVKRTERGTYVVYGRSDATLNRGGVRMGTAEFYRVVEAIDGVADALVVDTSELGRSGELLLFVVVAPGHDLDALTPAIREALRRELSPRHLPDRVLEVAALPRTLNGKKVEVPIRRILLGTPADQAVSHDALADPGALAGVLEALRAAALL